MRKLVGATWDSLEPIVLASAKLHRRWPGLGGGAIHPSLAKRTIQKEEVATLGRNAPFLLVRDGRSVILGRVVTPEAAEGTERRTMVEHFDPALVTTWRRSRIRVNTSNELVIFPRKDPAAAHALPPVEIDNGEMLMYTGRARRHVKLYPNRSVAVEYLAVALGVPPEGTRLAPSDDVALPLEATAELEKEVEPARFMMARFGHMIVLGASTFRDWEGAPSVHEKGPRPYRDAQRIRDAGVISVDGRDALVMDPHSAVGMLARPDGMIFSIWRAASSEAAAVMTALSIPEDTWKVVGQFHTSERDVVMMDSGVAGRKLEPWDYFEGTLPSTGTYDVLAVPLYGADVKRLGELETATIAAVRLRKVP